jgi:hypothetical protein
VPTPAGADYSTGYRQRNGAQVQAPGLLVAVGFRAKAVTVFREVH